MTSDQSDDYQYHRTNTPESPRPIYPPEPANIPVLKNMNDPAFTDSSTYDIRPSSQLHAVEGGNADNIEMLRAEQTAREGAQNGRAATFHENDDFAGGQGEVGSQIQAYNFQSIPNQAETQFNYDSIASNVQGSSLPHSDVALSKTLETLAKSQPNATPAQNDPSATLHSGNKTQIPFHGSHEQQIAPRNAEASFGVPQHTVQSDVRADQAHMNDGVNYQSLLETLTRSTSAAASTENVGARTSSIPPNSSVLSPASHGRQLPSAAGLPPRPPPQDLSAVFPSYPQNDNITSYHQINALNALNALNAPAQSYPSHPTNSMPNAGLPPIPLSGNAPGTLPGPNGLPPPPLATFQQGAVSMNNQTAQASLQAAAPARTPFDQSSVAGSDDGEQKWGPEVQRKYDQFLDDERAYVTEGVWDRFPTGSRMFVGNLPTEKVTKRDLFHIFHKHGKLAQISIKQAYGFVQFLDSVDCSRALEAEQNVSIRGRRLHLEISKPQKNTRGSGAAENSRQAGRKRSRSPDRRRRGQDHGYEARPAFSDQRDESFRRRDDYRPLRSPSPRGYRGRDEYRSRESNQYSRGGERSRSPYGRYNTRHRSPSPRPYDLDNEADLAIPRRHPDEVPDVQIIVLDDVDRNFIGYLENGLRSKGLQCQTLMLSPRLTLSAIVKRQVIEGVQAIIKLTRSSQYNGKVPLQVFDRSAGVDVRFNEYVDLDINVAAEIVLQNKRSQRLPYSANQTYSSVAGPIVYGQQAPAAIPPAPSSSNANVASMISNLDGPSLQKLLSAMQQQQQQQIPSQQPPISVTASTSGAGNHPDLASLISSVARQQQQQQSRTNQPSHLPNQLHASGPQGYGGSGQIPNNQQPPDMQNIMDQLARYRR